MDFLWTAVIFFLPGSYTVQYIDNCILYTVQYMQFRKAELGTSLFEIAQSLFALEQTFILGAMALNKKKSEEQRAN